MTFADLSSESLAFLREARYDECLEKHEGPESWSSVLEYYGPELIEVDVPGRGPKLVLLPLAAEDAEQIEVLRCDPAAGDPPSSLTLFLRDHAMLGRVGDDEHGRRFDAGRLAVCDPLPGSDVYYAVFYHARYETGMFD